MDKSGCISFLGRRYEVGLAFLGATVDVIYDPADTTELTIEKEGHESFTVRELVIGERAGQRPKLPEHLGKPATDHSRLLSAAARQQTVRQKENLPAVSYRSVRGADEHV